MPAERAFPADANRRPFDSETLTDVMGAWLVAEAFSLGSSRRLDASKPVSDAAETLGGEMTEAGILDALGQPPRPVVMPVIVMLLASDGEEITTHPRMPG